ncbi:MAG: hypothetical protein AAF513_10300, partial [Pseudomonadota bacterium]
SGGRFVTMNDFTNPSAPVGTVRIDGPGSSINIERGNAISMIDIGSQGTSEMTITNGGKFIASRTPGTCPRFACFDGQLTNAAGSQLNLTVNGAGSEFTVVSENNQAMHIGKAVVIDDGNGFRFGTPGGTSNANVNIENGGTFNTGFAVVATTSAGNANTGTESANGLVRVEGNGSAWNADDIAIGFPSATNPLAPKNSGVVIVSNGAEINSRVFVGANGILAGNGTVNGTVDNRGGLVAPGLSPGTLTINGDFLMSSGTLHLEIGGTAPGMFDMLDVSGLIDITGGDILFDFINNFVPGPNDLLQLLSASSISIASDVNYRFAGISSAAGAMFDPLTGRFQFVNVPEPGVVALLLGALLLLRRRIGNSI